RSRGRTTQRARRGADEGTCRAGTDWRWPRDGPCPTMAGGGCAWVCGSFASPAESGTSIAGRRFQIADRAISGPRRSSSIWNLPSAILSQRALHEQPRLSSPAEAGEPKSIPGDRFAGFRAPVRWWLRVKAMAALRRWLNWSLVVCAPVLLLVLLLKGG